jgi:hypothetical protein
MVWTGNDSVCHLKSKAIPMEAASTLQLDYGTVFQPKTGMTVSTVLLPCQSLKWGAGSIQAKAAGNRRQW